MRYTTLLALFFVAGVLALPAEESGKSADNQSAETDDIDLPGEFAQQVDTPVVETRGDILLPADAVESDTDMKEYTLTDGANTVQAFISFNSSSLSEFRTTIMLGMGNKKSHLSLSRSSEGNKLHLSLNEQRISKLHLNISKLYNGSAIIINLHYNSSAHGICAAYQRLWKKEKLKQVGACVPVPKTQSETKSKTQSGTGNMTAFYSYHGGVHQTNFYKATTGLFLDAKVSSEYMGAAVSEYVQSDSEQGLKGDGPMKSGPPIVTTEELEEGVDTLTETIHVQSTMISEFSTNITLQQGDSHATIYVSGFYNNRSMNVHLGGLRSLPVDLDNTGSSSHDIYLGYNSTSFCGLIFKNQKTPLPLGCVQRSSDNSGPWRATYSRKGMKEIVDFQFGKEFVTEVTVLDADGKPPISTHRRPQRTATK